MGDDQWDSVGMAYYTTDQIEKWDYFIAGLSEGRKEKELSYEVKEATKVELNKCNTIEDKMEWLGKVLGQAIFKNDMNYAVWVNVQKNNIIEHLEKENEELKEQIEKMEKCWNCKFFKEKKYQACIDYKKNNTKCCAFYKWESVE